MAAQSSRLEVAGRQRQLPLTQRSMIAESLAPMTGLTQRGEESCLWRVTAEEKSRPLPIASPGLIRDSGLHRDPGRPPPCSGPLRKILIRIFLWAPESKVIIHHDDVSSRIVYGTTVGTTYGGYGMGDPEPPTGPAPVVGWPPRTPWSRAMSNDARGHRGSDLTARTKRRAGPVADRSGPGPRPHVNLVPHCK